MKRRAGVAALLAAAGLGACRVGPEYQAPTMDLPERFAVAAEPGAVAAEARWWSTFGDPALDRLIERAMAGNVDLAAARERLLEARARRDAAFGGTRPTLDAKAGVARTGPSDGGAFPGRSDFTLSEIGVDASWEVDVFGRTGAFADAAEAGVASAEEARRAALVALCAEVAREYVTLRETQRQLGILRSNLATQADTLALTRARAQAGFSPELDVARSEAQVESTAAAIPTQEARALSAIHRIGVLLGEAPNALVAELAPEAPIPVARAQVDAGLPADVVRRRPDVRRAERELERETALTAQATAELYPRITLSASVGREAREASDLFDAASNAWSIGGGILAPLFRGGTLRANLREQEARRAQAALAWKSAVLTALREVETALSDLAREKERAARLDAAVAASRRSLVLARDLEAQGLEDFFEVLEAQSALLSAEAQLAGSQAAVARGTVDLYAALGGAPDLPDATTMDP